jgi:cytochrome c oxidase subunit 4
MTAHSEHIEHNGYEGHGGHHVTEVSVFLKVFAALMVLLFATVGAAFVDLTKIVPLPGLNIFVMLFIAILKATLVVLYFMEVKKGTKLTWLWAGVGFFWFLTMFEVFFDYLTRSWSVRGW